jgi:hypothetical protein
MQSVPRASKAGRTTEDRANLTFWTLGATGDDPPPDSCPDGDVTPRPISVQERVRKLPEALLLTAGYYAGRAPVLGDLLRRPR